MSLENNTNVVQTSIDQMPIEILVTIFNFIPPNELAQICVNVSIKWKELITSCILQPILRNLSLCSHEIKQKLISMGWSDDNNELQSADKNDPDLILSLFERHKRKYYLYNNRRLSTVSLRICFFCARNVHFISYFYWLTLLNLLTHSTIFWLILNWKSIVTLTFPMIFKLFEIHL